MKKHVFRDVSECSSYFGSIVPIRDMKLRKIGVLILLALILSPTCVYAEPEISLSRNQVKPSEYLVISGNISPNSMIFIKVSGTRSKISEFNASSDDMGHFTVSYSFPVDSKTDIYTIEMKFNDKTIIRKINVSQDSNLELAENLRIIVENARKEAEASLIKIKKKGQVPRSLIRRYSGAIDSLGEAKVAIREGNHEVAVKELQYALQGFKYIIGYSNAPNFQVSENKEFLLLVEQSQLLDKRVNVVKMILEAMKIKEYPVSSIEKEVANITSDLDQAGILLEERRLDEAKELFASIEIRLQDVLQMLRMKQSLVAMRLALRYEASLSKRVEAYVITFQRLEVVRPYASRIALNELNLIEDELVYVGILLEEENVKDALRVMRVVDHRLNRVAYYLESRVSVELLFEIDRLAASSVKSPDNVTLVQIDSLRNRLLSNYAVKTLP